MEISFFPIDVDYKVIDGKAVIFLYGRADNGQRVCVLDDSFQPYFYIISRRNIVDKVKKLRIDLDGESFFVVGVEEVSMNYLERPVNALKVYVNLPKAVPEIRKAVKEWEDVERTLEYDILFTRRYLIDKNIMPLTLLKVSGEVTHQHSKITCIKAGRIELAGDETYSKPRILSFDIETYNPEGKSLKPEKYPVLMVAFYGENFQKVVTWKHFKSDNDFIEFVKSEADLIERFKEVVDEFAPDYLVGYYSDGFDFPYIKTRAKKYKIKLDLGLDYSEINISKGDNKKALIAGLVHIDIFRFVKSIIRDNLETDTFTLDSVAQELLGVNKLKIDVANLAHDWDNNINLDKYCEYNLHDAKITFELLSKLLPNLIELVKIVNVPVSDLSRMRYSQLVEWYILKQAKLNNELAPNKPDYREQQKRLNTSIKGAFVYEPKPGLYRDIVVFDYRSLYPSIIASHNISHGSLNCDCCEGKDVIKTDRGDFWYCKNKKGFLSAIIEDLITRRSRVKELLKKSYDPLLDARSYGLKILANSFYGYLGFAVARWYFIEGAESTTAFARKYILETIDSAVKEGFSILYSDSLPYDRRVFVQNHNGDINIKKIGEFYNTFQEGDKTLSLTKDKKVRFVPVIRVIRHKLESNSQLLKIITKYGSTIVTNKHSIYEFDKEIKIVRADELKKGDYLISLTKPEFNVKYKEGYIFDLADINLGDYRDKLMLYKDSLEFPAKKGRCVYCGKYALLSGHVSLQHKERKTKLSKKSKFSCVGSINASGGKIPRYWRLDKDLAWLLGFYCAEGSVSDVNTKTGFKRLLSFGSQDLAIIEKVKSILDSRINANLKIIKNFDKRINKFMYYYRVQRIPIVALFEYGFDCGKKSEFKRVPYFMFNAEDSLRSAFVKGYLDGDGEKNIEKRYITKFVRFSTKSKELAIGLQFLLKSLDYGRNSWGREIRHISWLFRKDKPKINALRLQSAKFDKENFCLAEIKSIEIMPNEEYVYDLEVKDAHNFVDAEGMILVHNTDSIFILLENKSKDDAFRFVEKVNLNLPGLMELEFENFYPSGMFVSVKGTDVGAKKKYALIDEHNKLKIRGFETVRRNWSPIAKEVQKNVLDIVLKNNDVKKAVDYVRDVVKKLRSNEVVLDKVVIFTQLQKDIESYENVGPHVAAAQRMKNKGFDVFPGTAIRFVVAKGLGKIRDKVRLYDEVSQDDYDGEYYINNQVIPSVERIFHVLGIKEEDLIEKDQQKTLGSFG